MSLEGSGSHGDDIANEKPQYSNDLQRVGPDKPLSYLPASTLIKSNGEDPLQVIQLAREKGFFATAISKKDNSDATIVVADTQSLSKLLEERKSVLEFHGWPTEIDAFIKRILTQNAPEKTDLFDLIADAFGDKTNEGRTDVEGTNSPPRKPVFRSKTIDETRRKLLSK